MRRIADCFRSTYSSSSFIPDIYIVY
ncbi:hypothetical protein IE077_003897 [Cardiosporidium cionae]|uniref:Uncharacterized protein n=1 Tax=Cardiosporidium cionae TaxID=476202 RepID=A0ABQ7JEE4_9APIC|nr:hypothetical protein IE077_003897 [Cardiosporidium cionae]|eukprot:KAF8822377.1 hypothetical protein IE077_003897 [Cardiosporidium cionae]